jgi:hypothetical protein
MHSTLGTYHFESSNGKARMYWRLELVCIAISIYLLFFCNNICSGEWGVGKGMVVVHRMNE